MQNPATRAILNDVKDPYKQALLDIVERPVNVFLVNDIAYVMIHKCDKKKASFLASGYHCNECRDRAKNMIPLEGPDGPIFLANVDSNHLKQEKVLGLLRAEAMLCCKRGHDISRKKNIDVLVVDKDTFPCLEKGTRNDGTPWLHFTIVPNHITNEVNASRFKNTWKQYGIGSGNWDTRVQKIVDASPSSFGNVMKAAMQSNDPDHWKSTLEWCSGIRERSQGRSFSYLDAQSQIDLLVFAASSGTVSDVHHVQYQMAENIVDFLQQPDVPSILSNMNGRADPRTYQVSQVVQAMDKHKVTDPRTISLAWLTEDDLDLHIWIPHTPQTIGGVHVYYRNKQAGGCSLNFDANAGQIKVTNPVENVSVHTLIDTEYHVLVNNYHCYGQDVPFTVVIKDIGQPDIVKTGVWRAAWGSNTTTNRNKMITVCRHKFNDHPLEDIVMSDKEALRTQKNADEWDKHFGTLKSRVATINDVSEENLHLFPDDSHTTKAADVSDMFLALAMKAVQKPTLPDPKTIADLIYYIKQTAEPLWVRVYDVSPGYMTKITGTSGDFMTSDLQPCHYRDQGQLPTIPTTKGSARACHEWFRLPKGETSLVKVSAIVNTGKTYFMVLEDAKLPSRASSKFPLGGGFYPTSLKPEFHHHRSRFAAHHSMLVPTCEENKHPPLIGGFILEKDTHTFYIGQYKRALTIHV